MRIEISAGGIGGISVADFHSDMQTYIANAESVISSFKAIQSSTCNLNGGVGSLQGALDEIDQRVASEASVQNHAQRVQSKAADFIQLAERIDKQVATDVTQNKDELYRVNPWLRPRTSVEDTPWYEDAWNWLCDKGEQIADGLKNAWDWTKDTAKKAWDGLVDFYEKHWYDIVNWGVTILCAVGSIVAIALIPVTGGASILLVAGVSAISGAIVAATRSITTQQRDKGTVDWGEVGKEAATAAVVGAITGAIGAGVGGAITSGLSNTGLGASLLNSSSTTVRVLTGATIGSTSEVASGMLTRGAAEATESYLETGSVNFGDVWDAATDPQQMFQDAVIGGATGGLAAKNAPEPTQPKYGSVHDEGFPEESMQAVSDYVGPNHYQEINQSYYDSSVELSPQNQKIDLELTKTLDQSTIPESMTTYHGGSLKEMGDLGDIALKYKNDPAGLQNALEGKTYTKQGYLSTGEPKLAKSYTKDLSVTIDVPAGSKGLDVSISAKGGSEYLFPANSQLDIVSAEWSGGKLNIHATLNHASPGDIPNTAASQPRAMASRSSEVSYWQQSENKVDAFLGKDYHKQISINSSDLSAGKYGGAGTIRVDDLRGEINGIPQDLTNMDSFTKMEHFDAAEVKNYRIETSSGRSGLKKNIIDQSTQRNEVLAQYGATVNQTYYVDTTGHPITIGQWERLYDRLEKVLPDNVDIFPLWK